MANKDGLEKLVLIDGNSLLNRAFYAMPLLSTKDGVYTNAVFGFMNMFFRMVEDVKPTYVVVAFDLKAPTFRSKIYSEYKGTRKPMPEELRGQFPILKDILKLMNVRIIEKEGYEADDIIGTIAKNTGIKTIIITGDKDSFQLVDEETDVYFTRRGVAEIDVMNVDNFYEKTGILPSQVIELKALMGDASDNIPGVKGIGEKTAVSLLQSYKNVDGIYSNIDEIKGKLKEKLEQGKEICFLSRTLATIKTDCDIDLDTEKMRFKLPLSDSVREKFKQLEFKALSNKKNIFDKDGKEKADDMNSVGQNEQNSFESERIITTNNYKRVEVSDNVESTVCEDLSQINENDFRVFSACFTDKTFYLCNGKREFLISIKENILDNGFFESEAIDALKPVFKSAERIVLFSKKEFKHRFFDLVNDTEISKYEDLSILKYLVDYSGKAENLGDAMSYYGYQDNKYAYNMLLVFNDLYAKLIEQKLEKLYLEVELPLADLLFDMEENGFKIDVNALENLGNEYFRELKDLEKQIRLLAGEENLNINSPKQLGIVLFEKLKLGKKKKTKSGYSTSAEVLEELTDSHEIIPLILKYRQIQKLYSTYVEGFKSLVDRSTGIIKTSFNQTVTSTGRLSSKEPNLQNIPVRDEEGKKLRKFFVPRNENNILISADYSQIELRLLASFSGCKGLCYAFNNNVDVHTETASKVFKVDRKDVTDKMRRMAKAVNFGIIYGISEYGLSKNLKISVKDAREYINSYFDEYPEVKDYMNGNVLFAKENGYAITMMGRRRYFKDINSSNHALRQFSERAAMNMPLQGSSADIIKVAMLKVNDRLKREGLKSSLILQIHDELIIDALKTEQKKVEEILVYEMENAVKLNVPLTVSKSTGENWYEAK